MTAFDEARKVLEKRLAAVDRQLEGFAELQAERGRLIDAIRALTDGRRGSTRTRRRRGGSGGPTRRDQVLEAVRNNPGTTTTEIAKKLGMQASGVTNVLTGLRGDGLVRTENRQHYLK